MDKDTKLTIPDYITLSSLFLAWSSILLVLHGEPNLAIIVNLMAVALDLLDGLMARRLRLETVWGGQIDSFSDIFTYLVFSVILFSKYLSPNIIVSIIVGYSILVFGCLRLIRFNREGLLKDKSGGYYRGLPVFFIGLLTFVFYVLSTHLLSWNPMLTTVTLLGISPFMLSNIKIYKLKGYILYATVLFILMSIVLF